MSDRQRGSDPQGSAGPVSDLVLAGHTHHWLIGNQDGPSSQGVCKECGERREFSNSFTRRKSSWTTRSQSQQHTPNGTASGSGQ